MPACRTILSLAVALSMTLCLGVARAQAPAEVNKPGVTTQGTEVKDENGKSMRLKKGDPVTVIYERGEYYWVKSRKGQQAWVLKNFVRVKEEGAAEEPEKAEPVKTKVSKKGKSKKEEARKEEVKKEEAKTEETKTEEPKAEAKTEEVKIEARTEAKVEQTKTETLVAANTTNHTTAAAPQFSNKRAGVIDVIASEAGARVSVDGQDLGQAPLRGVQVKGGPHVVSVEKPGFLPSNAQVEVDGGATKLALALVPTVQTRDDYTSGTWMWRIIGYSGVGLGAGAVLAGLGMGGWGLTEAGTVRKDIDNYNRSENRTEDERTDLVARRDGAQLKFLIGEVALVSGFALAAVGVVAYMFSGDPDRYAAYESVK